MSDRGQGRWRALPGLVLATVAVAGLWSQARSSTELPSPLPCARAGLVDGQLRCDDELPSTVAALCDGAARSSPDPIVGGDAIDTAQACAQPVAHPGGTGRTRMAAADLAALRQPVPLNHASVQELTSLPRVGPVLARRIVESRPFASVDELLRVRGIGPVTLERLRPRVRIDPPAP